MLPCYPPYLAAKCCAAAGPGPPRWSPAPAAAPAADQCGGLDRPGGSLRLALGNEEKENNSERELEVNDGQWDDTAGGGLQSITLFFLPTYSEFYFQL